MASLKSKLQAVPEGEITQRLNIIQDHLIEQESGQAAPAAPAAESAPAPAPKKTAKRSK